LRSVTFLFAILPKYAWPLVCKTTLTYWSDKAVKTKPIKGC
jgi:hypothetical protein